MTLLFCMRGYAQTIGVKTNLLYDATSTLNLGVEVGTAPKWSLDVSGNFNPWAFNDNRKMKHWILGNRWNLEASIGVGYAYLDYTKYKCKKCGEKLGSGHKNYVGPTKAAISLIYIIK